MAEHPADLNMHASCVCFEGFGVLILGASGSGKSSLALQLMSLGAELVADDRTELAKVGEVVIASAPQKLSGLIEARGVGILRAKPQAATPVSLAIDMDMVETERFPPDRWTEILDVRLRCLHKIDAPHFNIAISQYLRAGRLDPT